MVLFMQQPTISRVMNVPRKINTKLKNKNVCMSTCHGAIHASAHNLPRHERSQKKRKHNTYRWRKRSESRGAIAAAASKHSNACTTKRGHSEHRGRLVANQPIPENANEMRLMLLLHPNANTKKRGHSEHRGR